MPIRVTCKSWNNTYSIDEQHDPLQPRSMPLPPALGFFMLALLRAN